MKKTLAVKKRKRRTNLELAGISRVHLRMIDKASELVKVPADVIWADVVEIGVAGVLSSYAEIMQARERMEKERRLREEHIRDLFSDEPKPVESTGSGSTEESDELVEIQHAPRTDAGPSDGPSADDPERSIDAAIEPGYVPEAGEDIGSVDPDGEIAVG